MRMRFITSLLDALRLQPRATSDRARTAPSTRILLRISETCRPDAEDAEAAEDAEDAEVKSARRYIDVQNGLA
jgi:hypothetical protein